MTTVDREGLRWRTVYGEHFSDAEAVSIEAYGVLSEDALLSIEAFVARARVRAGRARALIEADGEGV